MTTNADLTGRVMVVTGASRGVGRGIALELGTAGATVYVTGRSRSNGPTTDNLAGTIDQTAADVTERGGVGIALPCDHTHDADVAALFEHVQQEQGRLDVLVNNVWGGYEQHDMQQFLAPFWEQPLRYWPAMFEAGVRAHYMAQSRRGPPDVATTARTDYQHLNR